jgi:hypothetical protein
MTETDGVDGCRRSRLRAEADYEARPTDCPDFPRRGITSYDTVLGLLVANELLSGSSSREVAVRETTLSGSTCGLQADDFLTALVLWRRSPSRRG